ncbi:MAG TPA: ligase-associated DNA damage response exonuclease [Alphaproteobacteria bacterium]|nr:ligase-associated DNA damage response exonuclease [Alphaproteobacteria bacterium]
MGMAHSIASKNPVSWLGIGTEGLYCASGGFHIDPVRPVERAVITHGHSDHARPGHGAALATPETIAIMQARHGTEFPTRYQPLAYGQTIRLGDVTVSLAPAGHVLGSAQVVLEHAGARVVVSGDYKRRPDPTCQPFLPVPCDVFVTEATFGLPVFRHPDDAHEIERLLHSLAVFPERAHLVGTYALGKCQRVIRLLRKAGYDRPIFVHGALLGLCELYERLGVPLGPLVHVTGANKAALRGQIVLAPPSAAAERWSRALPDPVVAMASGWMRIKQRAKAGGVELPLVISDHADWDELDRTVEEVGAPEIWITHGREEALLHHFRKKGYRARALALAGFEEEGQ